MPYEDMSLKEYEDMSLKELEEMKSDLESDLEDYYWQLYKQPTKLTKKEQDRILPHYTAAKELFEEVKEEIKKRDQAIVLDESSLPTISGCSNQKLLELKEKRDNEISFYVDCMFRLPLSQLAERRLAVEANRKYFQQVEAEINKRKQQGRFWDDN